MNGRVLQTGPSRVSVDGWLLSAYFSLLDSIGLVICIQKGEVVQCDSPSSKIIMYLRLVFPQQTETSHPDRKRCIPHPVVQEYILRQGCRTRVL